MRPKISTKCKRVHVNLTLASNRAFLDKTTKQYFSHSSLAPHPKSKENEAGIFGFIFAFLPRATQECREENHEQRNVLSRSTSGNPRKEFHDFFTMSTYGGERKLLDEVFTPFRKKILGKRKIFFHILNTHFSLVGSGSAENNNRRENSAKTKKPIFQIFKSLFAPF